MKNLLIHIGMPKTATKTLQWRLFAQHSEVFYLGRYDGPDFRKYQEFQNCRDAEVQASMGALAYQTKNDCSEVNNLAMKLRQYLDRSEIMGRLPVWSWESLCTDRRSSRKARARNLYRAFPEAKILVTIRHPIKLLESAFLLQLRRDNVSHRARRGQKHFFCEIDDWFEQDAYNEVSNQLDYSNTIRTYTNLFGAQQVCVMVFEQLLSDKHAFYKRLTDFMGIDLEESLTLVGEHVDNSRWTKKQLQQLKVIDASFWQSLKFRFSSRPARRRWLYLDANNEPLNQGEKARCEMSESGRSQIMERTLAGNKWLDSTFDLGLDRYGYYENSQKNLI